MEELERHFFFQSLLAHGAWLAPLLIGAAGAIRILRSDQTTGSKIHSSFLWAFLAVTVGYVGLYVTWRYILLDFLTAAEISFDLFLIAVRNSLLPAGTGLVAAAALLIVATWLIRRDEPLQNRRSVEVGSQAGANGT